ncbi:MAG: hypothetical protein NT145_00065 [Elusimicrobia bacterium]|nr:hypothetical protein [Elusimicrobiota bacterium]
MKRLFLVGLIFVSLTSSLFSQEAAKPIAPLQLSLYGDLCFPVKKYDVAGIGLGVFHSKIDKVYGIQAAGFVAQNDTAYGLEIAGMGATSNKFCGIQIAGFGAQNMSLSGIQLSGFGCNTKTLYGIGISSIFAYENLYGFCFEIFGDIKYAKKCRGVQISGITSKIVDIKGLQVSLYNETESCNGVQAGLVNIADNVRGLQIGIYNSCTDLKGVQLGLLNHCKKNTLFDVNTLPLINIGI